MTMMRLLWRWKILIECPAYHDDDVDDNYDYDDVDDDHDRGDDGSDVILERINVFDDGFNSIHLIWGKLN